MDGWSAGRSLETRGHGVIEMEPWHQCPIDSPSGARPVGCTRTFVLDAQQHCKRANGQYFNLILSSEDSTIAGADYYLKAFQANFVGWKFFRCLVADFKARVAAKALKEEKTVQQIAQENEIAPPQVSDG